MNTLYLVSGKLNVTAKGYWFTSGGEKGSFGYYPHLKRTENGQAFPVIPDTQIHGDLRMAAQWLGNQEGAAFDKSLVEEVFGKGGSRSPSLFSVTDLELNGDSKGKWSPNLFVVRPRSEIDDEKRTNKEQMLAFRELSYLDDLTLEADFYMGYFKDEARAKKALGLLQGALNLLSGFGAFRSRGYSRGEFKIEESNIASVQVPALNPACSNETFRYTLTPLCHFRNKPINPARTQLLRSEKLIAERQIKAWFAKAYQELFVDWPNPRQMSGIRFSPCYPALEEGKNVTPGYPPPFSTLMLEDGTIEDCFGEKPKENDPADQENFVRSKAKPIGETLFLTNENPPRAFPLRTLKRLRNSMTSGFVTLEAGGLFVQEFIEKQQPFCGSVALSGSDPDFSAKARFLLNNVYPKINGAFFKPNMEALPHTSGNAGVAGEQVFLLTAPMNFSPDRMDKGLQIRLGTVRNYNTRLRRPRRNRVVLTPGSLVSDAFGGVGINWKGLSSPNPVDATRLQKAASASVTQSPLPQPEAAMKSLTRAQIGNLRRFLEMTPELAGNRIKALLGKYDKWKKKTIAGHLIPEEYLREAKKRLDEGKTEEFKGYIQGILQQYAVAAWQEKSKKAFEKPAKGGTHGDAE